MKRDATCLHQVSDWQWLCECAARAARGKRHRSSVQRYFNALESSTGKVQTALLNAQLPEQKYRCFTITDPKPRIIHAAPFPDRVAHHAIIGKLSAKFERAQVASSYACRPGKGAHAAILHAQRIAGCCPWLLKMDVNSYFAHIDHEVLQRLLARLFKNAGLLSLLGNVIDSYCTQPGRGLPIGALTSQYFANHYLDGLQRFLRNQADVIDELRYMDDVLVGCPSKDAADDIAALTSEWLYRERHLTLKPVLIQRAHIGVPFCGFTTSSRRLTPGIRRKRAVRAQYQRIASNYRAGKLTEQECQSQICSTAALLKPGMHRSFAQKTIDNTGINSICC
ncbi:MAG: reverse transcriptase/maturase family protein [Pseudomonadota bacterium]